ncbi:MAG: peptidase M16, partial [Candidatus Aminicenantes bacterium]|nr:peptidase M16 [Candidatus Aminicenantes bacterium]
IKGGQHAEPGGKSGLAYITTRLTLEIPDQSKTQELMNQATHIYMACREDFSHITLSCLSENLKDALEVMSKIFSKPLFSGIRIDRLKEQMERQQDRDADEPFNQAHNAYMKFFFSGSPYANSIYGDEGSRKATKKKDIQLFFQKYFKSENMVAVVSTDLPEDEIKSMMNSCLGVFPEGSSPEAISFELSPEVREAVTIEKDTQQSFVSAGFYIDNSSPTNYIHALLVDNLLGKGINSRLWDLRIKEKLAYNVNSRFTYTQEGILLEAFLETENTKREAAREALYQTLSSLFSEGIEEDELNTTKAFAKSLLLRNNETKENRTRSLAYFETMGLGYDFMEKIFAQIDATTLQELNTFIQTYLSPEKALFVIIGPST